MHQRQLEEQLNRSGVPLHSNMMEMDQRNPQHYPMNSAGRMARPQRNISANRRQASHYDVPTAQSIPMEEMPQYHQRKASKAPSISTAPDMQKPVTKAGGHEVIRKAGGQQLELLISDKTVEKIMGPEPIPSLDIEMPLIANELQRKMVEEIQCVMCLNFPFSPKECVKCNKLFCKHCQQQLMGASTAHNEDDFADPELHKIPKDKLAQMSPAQRQ